MVFFKGKDADVITQAFKEFVKVNEKKRGRVQGAAWQGQEQGTGKGTPEGQGAVVMSKIIDGIAKDLKAIPETLKAKTAGVDKKKLILMNLPYILVGYFCDKIAWLWRVSPGSNASDKMMAAMNGLNDLFSNPLPSFFPKDLLIGIMGGVALRLVVYFKAKNAKKFRQAPGNAIPPDSYDDATVQALMEEAAKYLGYPYVWGGSSPSTSFDCSGFVCWVFTNSGVHNLPRTTAQGIYDQCTPVSASEAKAGDIIFFTGTYNSAGAVSHVGIYCGNGVMIHCGDPIKYASINTPYWQSHFYSFGRLN